MEVTGKAICGAMVDPTLMKAQIEFMAAACCYAEFTHKDALKHTPLGYWRGVADEARAHYRTQAKALLVLMQLYPQVRDK